MQMQAHWTQYAARFPDHAKPVPEEYAGQWVAWNAERTEIVSRGGNRRDVPRRDPSARLFASHSPDDTLRADRGRHMRFNYTAMVSWSPDTGEPSLIFRPEIRIAGPRSKGSRRLPRPCRHGIGQDDPARNDRPRFGHPDDCRRRPSGNGFWRPSGWRFLMRMSSWNLCRGTENFAGSHGSVSLPRAHQKKLLVSAIMAFLDLLHRHV